MIKNGIFKIKGMRKKLPGILEITESKISIEFSVTQSYNKSIKFPETCNIEGRLADGSQITLLDCYQITFNSSFIGIFTILFNANSIVYGKSSFKDFSKIKVDSARFRITNLETLVQISGLKYESNRDTKNSFSLHYRLPSKIPLFTKNGLKLSIEFDYKASIVEGAAKAQIFQFCYLSIETNKRKTSNLLEKVAYNFTKLLSMILYLDCKIMSFDIIQNKNEPKAKLKIVRPGFSDVEPNKPLLNQAILPFNEILSNKKILKNFYSAEVEYILVLNLLYEVTFKKHYFDENSFLNIIQAYEGFFKRFIEDDYRIKFKLKKDDKITLDNIIQSVFDQFPKSIFNKVSQNKETLKRKAVKSRNYYNHYHKQKSTDVLEGVDLFILTEKMKFVLLYTIFISLGVNPDFLEKNLIFHRSSKFYQAFT